MANPNALMVKDGDAYRQGIVREQDRERGRPTCLQRTIGGSRSQEEGDRILRNRPAGDRYDHELMALAVAVRKR